MMKGGAKDRYTVADFSSGNVTDVLAAGIEQVVTSRACQGPGAGAARADLIGPCDDTP